MSIEDEDDIEDDLEICEGCEGEFLPDNLNEDGFCADCEAENNDDDDEGE